LPEFAIAGWWLNRLFAHFGWLFPAGRLVCPELLWLLANPDAYASDWRGLLSVLNSIVEKHRFSPAKPNQLASCALDRPLSDTARVLGRSAWGCCVSNPPDLRVMIVEDQALIAMELELILGECGCDVVGCATDKDCAIAIAGRNRLDLALIDLNLLDGLTGPEIAQRMIREFGCAVVFLTANPEQIPDGFSGALGAVSKPFDESTICAVVAFARQFIQHRTLGEPPRRFRLAPWLTSPTAASAPL